jgi:hypothetical protein
LKLIFFEKVRKKKKNRGRRMRISNWSSSFAFPLFLTKFSRHRKTKIRVYLINC